jgi:2,5-diketo-D-gluconate reductase B
MDTPRVGLGTMGIHDADAITNAIELGYRHLDTAQVYDNESVVGEGIRQSNVHREELFVATKIWASDLATEDVRPSAEKSLARLGLDTVDLLYVHRPIEAYDPPATLPAFDDLVADGLTEHVGVSNFTRSELATAREHLDAPIFAHQIEYHPFFQTPDVLADNRTHDERVVAYSPIAQGKVFEDPVLQEIAEDHDTSPGSVAIAWLCQKDGVRPIPKAATPEHQRENLAAAKIDLSPTECDRIDGFDCGDELFPG